MYQNSILQKVCGVACILILIIASSVNMDARPQGEDIRINLELKNATLQKAMDEIKEQSPYLFFTSQVDLTKTITISVKNETIGNVCRQVFSPIGTSRSTGTTSTSPTSQ